MKALNENLRLTKLIILMAGINKNKIILCTRGDFNIVFFMKYIKLE